MSREILFRGKTQNCSYQENDKWIYGYYVKQENRHIITDTTRGCLGFGLEVNENTVGQFTGLTDKNGKKIFEGDIVKTKYGRRCFVEWRSTPCFCGFDLSVYANWNALDKAPSGWDLYVSENLEVVGNIYDNAELLGENK